MNTIFNETPNLIYSFNLAELQEELEQGYAMPIESIGKKSVLVFQNVDDHCDGNGLAILWLIKGNGRFYLEGEPIEMKVGDVLMFNDKIEHGFESDELCMGVNILLEKEYNLEQIQALIKELNKPQRKIKP